jgi:hypothetical protein
MYRECNWRKGGGSARIQPGVMFYGTETPVQG